MYRVIVREIITGLLSLGLMLNCYLEDLGCKMLKVWLCNFIRAQQDTGGGDGGSK